MTIFSPPNIKNSTLWRNMRVGILGGSFNPPHKGHVHISTIALKSLGLDAIWWLVTPQNPMKSKVGMENIKDRLIMCQNITKDTPRIVVTDIEEKLKTPHSYATIKKIKKHFPTTQFTWITGMDNAHNLHLWNEWTGILDEICMTHITRSPPIKLVKQCPARMLSTQNHKVIQHGGTYPLNKRTTYWLLQKKMVNISSTEIRNNNVKTIT